MHTIWQTISGGRKRLENYISSVWRTTVYKWYKFHFHHSTPQNGAQFQAYACAKTRFSEKDRSPFPFCILNALKAKESSDWRKEFRLNNDGIAFFSRKSSSWNRVTDSQWLPLLSIDMGLLGNKLMDSTRLFLATNFDNVVFFTKIKFSIWKYKIIRGQWFTLCSVLGVHSTAHS